MNKKQCLLLGFLFCCLIKQNVFSSYRPTSLHHTDREECRLLHRKIFAILHPQSYPRSSELSADTYRYVMASIAAFEAFKCSRFKNNF